MIRNRRRRQLNWPGIRAGWAMAAAGACVLVLVSLQWDPLDAGAGARAAATTAFALAQLGLLIVMIRIFQSLYARAKQVRQRD